MDVREWALITFTILAQMSVGAFVVLGIVHFYAMRKAGMQEADRLSDRALLAIGPVLALGFLASLLHLGNPLNAPRAFTNLYSSWLSREILFGVLFGALGAIFAFMQWRKLASFQVRNLIAWITALTGLALVYSMARVYMLDTQPAWNSWATPVLFFLTTFLLGALAIGTAFFANYTYVQSNEPSSTEIQRSLLRDTIRGISLAGMALLGLELLVIPLQIASLASDTSSAARTSLALLSGEFSALFFLRLLLVLVGAGVFGWFLYRNASSPGKEKMLGYLIFAAFSFVLVAEVLGRFLFYATHARVGI